MSQETVLAFHRAAAGIIVIHGASACMDFIGRVIQEGEAGFTYEPLNIYSIMSCIYVYSLHY